MNRRRFLAALGILPAAAVAAPALGLVPESYPWESHPIWPDTWPQYLYVSDVDPIANTVTIDNIPPGPEDSRGRMLLAGHDNRFYTFSGAPPAWRLIRTGDRVWVGR